MYAKEERSDRRRRSCADRLRRAGCAEKHGCGQDHNWPDSVTRLHAAWHQAELLLTRDAASVEAQVNGALQGKSYDAIVIGAGLRTLPAMADQFERLMNVLRDKAPRAKLAFNSRPDDSDAAAQRWL